MSATTTLIFTTIGVPHTYDQITISLSVKENGMFSIYNSSKENNDFWKENSNMFEAYEIYKKEVEEVWADFKKRNLT